MTPIPPDGLAPIEIEHGIPIPKGYGRLRQIREAILELKAGDSFKVCGTDSDRKLIYDAAYQVNIPVTTRKINDSGWRVWLAPAWSTKNRKHKR